MKLPAFSTRVSDLVMTSDPNIRFRLELWFVMQFTYLLYFGILLAQVALGFVSLVPALCVISASVSISVAFYVSSRRNWRANERFRKFLDNAPLIVGVFIMWATYALAGPASNATLIITASHVVYAIFSMKTREVWLVVAMELVGLGIIMVVCHVAEPARFVAEEQLVGFLYMALVLPLIARLATHVSTMTENYRQQRRELEAAITKVRDLATRDELTQTHNRRHMVELMNLQKVQHESNGSMLCLALLDIDFFKQVNDRYGHSAGDEVLRRFADAAKRSLRSSDLLGRWGGEEFMVMFPDTSMEQALAALARMRELSSQIDLEDIAPGLRVTFSGGLLKITAEERLEASIEKADQALYLAKSNGRNRVECDAACTP